MRKNPIQRFRSLTAEFPGQFWIVVGGTFVDRVGGAMLFPFFTLYLTRKFAIGMTQVGVLFGIFAVSSFVGSMVGGALTDRLGRKSIILFGLVMSASSTVLMGLVETLSYFTFIIILVGVLADVAAPAHQSLVADLLPEEQRAQGFGILRVAANLAVVIGPILGGFLASQNYLLLFIGDAITSLLTAVILFFALKETHHPKLEGDQQESFIKTFSGYLHVVRDTAYAWFLAASVLMVMVYMQMNTTLAVYLRDIHGVPERGYGYILSLNAAMVVLFQFPITRRITPIRPLKVMAAGTLLYAIGFSMYGYVSLYVLFLVAMAIITIGEMLVTPVSESIVAGLAPEEMRGRYMAVYGFSWLLPFAIGPFLAGLIMDNYDPRWVWYSAGIIGVLSAATYFGLEKKVQQVRYNAVEQRIGILENLESGTISAEEAALALEKITEGSLGRLAKAQAQPDQQHLRITVSDPDSGMIKSDLRIPLGLVNTILHGGGRLSSALEGYDQKALIGMIKSSAGDGSPQEMRQGDDHIQVKLE